MSNSIGNSNSISESLPRIDVWCHSCNAKSSAILDEISNDYECEICTSNFVEEYDEDDIENFISNDNLNNHDSNNQIVSLSDSSSGGGMGSNAFQHFLDRAFQSSSNAHGHSHTQTNIIQVVEQNSLNGGRRPVGFIIRQVGGNFEDLDMLSGLLGSNANDNNNSSGIMGLLSSLSIIRSTQHINNDANSMEQFLHHILMNENSHSGSPPATDQRINNLKRESINCKDLQKNYGECSISQEAFEMGDIAVSLPCGHSFKEDPITHWLKMHNTCPVCRIAID